MKTNPPQTLPLLAVALSLGLASSTQAALLVGLTTGGNLITFDSSAPGTILSTVAVTGLGGQTLQGIDSRPVNRQIYGVGSGGTLVQVSAFTGGATSVATLSTAPSGSSFGLDFNPVVDRFRVVSNTEQNLRINPASGATLVDGPLAYNVGDVNFGVNPNIVGVAYINNNPGVLSTTLYGIDSSTDTLVTQIPPNSGTLNTVGSLGVDASALAGFEIDFQGNAFAALTSPDELSSGLYSINLATGAATLIGQIGGGAALNGLTAIPEPSEYALLGGLVLVGFGLYRRRQQG
jgi:hypothetical protein